MSKLGRRLIKAAREGRAIARGEVTAPAKTKKIAKAKPTVAVKQKTLLGRVKRVLRLKGHYLWEDHRYGPLHYMLVDKVKDRVVRTNVELTALARRLKVMRPWEKLADE